MLPGGDPLDAAVAAGETPSLEMVAAAAETGQLPPALAVAVFCAIVAGLVGEAATSALILWTFYLALEPEVRSRWPRILIGWMRLLSGRVRDAMVGRETLLGVAAGIVGIA